MVFLLRLLPGLSYLPTHPTSCSLFFKKTKQNKQKTLKNENQNKQAKDKKKKSQNKKSTQKKTNINRLLFMLANYSWAWVYPGVWLRYSMEFHWRKTEFSFASGHHLQIGSWLRVGP